MLGIEKGDDKGEANNEKKTIYNLFHKRIYSFGEIRIAANVRGLAMAGNLKFVRP